MAMPRFLPQEMQGLGQAQCNSLHMLWILQYVDEKRWLAPRRPGLCAVNLHILKGVERKKVLSSWRCSRDVGLH